MLVDNEVYLVKWYQAEQEYDPPYDHMDTGGYRLINRDYSRKFASDKDLEAFILAPGHKDCNAVEVFVARPVQVETKVNVILER